LREIDTDTLVRAVRDNERMKNVFYHNMNSRTAEMMEFDVKYNQENEIKSAQNKIIRTAEKLGFIRGTHGQ
jgi:flagellar motor switch protein FliG